MTRVEFLYLLPYLLSLALSAGITIYAWSHRRVRGAGAYALLASAQVLTIFGFILELISPDISGKMNWDKFQWITSAIVSIAIPNFAIQYTRFKILNPKTTWFAFSIMPITIVIAVIADPWLHVLYPNSALSHSFLFGELTYDFNWLAYGFAAYAYITTLFAIILLARRIIRPSHLYRGQITMVITGLLIPVFGTILTFTKIQITPLRDIFPLTTAVGNIFVAWGIFRYHWLDIVHIARDKIIENMSDLVFVLDAHDRVVDINPTALQVLGTTSSRSIGKSAISIFQEFPEVINKFTKSSNTNLEVIVKRNEKYHHYDVKSTLLYDRRGDYQGRVFVARDITSYAALQWQLRELNEQLEKRVQARTEELAEAYDTTLEGWARALELRDKETEGHSWRVTELTMKLALALNVPHEEFDHIRRGAILHDIGKMAIPDEILRKTGPLSEQERDIVLQHPAIAYQLLARIPFLKRALDIPYCHHEKWDGTGYPRGLKGNDIPLAARIFTIADVWDAVQSDRPYKKGWSREDAIVYMHEQAGKYFDPAIMETFLHLVKEEKI